MLDKIYFKWHTSQNYDAKRKREKYIKLTNKSKRREQKMFARKLYVCVCLYVVLSVLHSFHACYFICDYEWSEQKKSERNNNREKWRWRQKKSVTTDDFIDSIQKGLPFRFFGMWSIWFFVCSCCYYCTHYKFRLILQFQRKKNLSVDCWAYINANRQNTEGNHSRF